MTRVATILVFLAPLLLLACGNEQKQKSPSPAPAAVPSPPPAAGQVATPSPAPAASPASSPAGGSSEDGEEKKKTEDDDAEDESPQENRFLVLQEDICQESSKTCTVYGLNAKPSKNGFCPYSKTCAKGKCDIEDVLDHYCNCIYQLEKGNTVFNGGKQNCIAEYKDAADE